MSHACIALATLVLLITGWLLSQSPSLAKSAMNVHYIAAAFLVFGLVMRIVLMMAGKVHERFAGLFPATSELSAMAAMLRSYISLGRSPMPGWYAQNPLWKPAYLIIYIALVVLVASGIAMPDMSLIFGFYTPSVHAFWAQFLLWFSALHIVGVVVHDYKNKTTDISAMVNGYRLFIIDHQRDSSEGEAVQIVTLDSLSRRE